MGYVRNFRIFGSPEQIIGPTTGDSVEQMLMIFPAPVLARLEIDSQFRISNSDGSSGLSLGCVSVSGDGLVDRTGIKLDDLDMARPRNRSHSGGGYGESEILADLRKAVLFKDKGSGAAFGKQAVENALNLRQEHVGLEASPQGFDAIFEKLTVLKSGIADFSGPWVNGQGIGLLVTHVGMA
jgi:hypothetical protein